MARHRSYIICGTPRSGSTLLCGFLESAGCGRPHSYFRRRSIPGFARDLGVPAGADFSRRYLAAVLSEGKGGTEVFGLRVMFDTLGELSAGLDTLFPGLETAPARLERAFGPPLFVHLSREDKLAQAVSLLRAEQTGLWHLAADGSELQRTVPHREAEYDPVALSALVADLTRQDRSWREWFAQHGIEPVRLTYEVLARDPQAALRDVLAGLGLDTAPAANISPRTAKLADAESESWIARLRAES